MTPTPWQRLDVASFIEQFKAKTQLNAGDSATDALETLPLIWQKQTVQAFFNANWWTAASPEIATDKPFDFRLTVNAYFQHFQWNAPIKDHSPATSAPQEQPSIPDFPPESPNLQNFSDLF